MQRACNTLTQPSSVTMALLGQAMAQGLSSHWRQSTGVVTLLPTITFRRG